MAEQKKKPVNISEELRHDVYFQQYVNKIINKVKVEYPVLEPGMVVDLHYNKELADGKTILKRYIIFVLSTKQVPGVANRYIYALNLEHVRPANFTRLIGRIGLDEVSAKLYRQKKVVFPRALIPTSTNPKTTYNLYIKPKLETTLNDSYRMFKKENIVKMFAVDFAWNPKLVEKYLVEDKPNIKGVNASEGDEVDIKQP